MSKSKLTGIAPSQITDTFGSDAFRYYFMKAIAFGQDGSFSWEDLSARYQSELANGFGNLASRVLAMVNRYFDGSIPQPTNYEAADIQVQSVAAKAISNAELAIDEMRRSKRYNQALTFVMIDLDHFKNVNDTHGHAAGGVGLRVKKQFCAHHMVGSGLFKIGHGHVIKILLVQQNAGTGVIHIQKTLQVAESIGAAQGLNVGIRQAQSIAFGQRKDQFRLERTFNVNVQLGLGHGLE
jgi:GGDEF domain-containing protein